MAGTSKRTQSGWRDLVGATNAPRGYKWQSNGARFTKNSNGSYSYNKNYKSRLVKANGKKSSGGAGG